MLLAKGILILIAYFVTYFAYGLLFVRLFKVREAGLIYTLVSGLFLHSLVFMVFVLVPKQQRVPLSTISLIWGILWIGSVVFFLFLLRKDAATQWKKLMAWVREEKANAALFAAFNLAQLLFNGMFGRWSSSNNPANYVGYVTTAVFTNELGTTDPITGLLRTSFDAKLFTQTMLDHSAVVSKIFRVHPLIEVRWVIPFMFLIVGNLIVFLIARTLFHDGAGQWLFFAVYQAVIMVMAGSYLTGSFYIYFRNYEGKNVMSALVGPLLIYVFWKLYQDPKDRESLILGILGVAGSYAFSGSALYMVPVMCLGLVPAMFSKKNCGRVILDAFLLSLPCLVYAAYYALFLKGQIVSLAIG